MRVCKVFKLVFLSCAVGFYAVFPISSFAAEKIHEIDFERQSLISALHWLSERAGFTVSSNSEYMKGKTVGPLKGRFTTRQAVAKLFEGLDIRYEWESDNVLILIEDAADEAPTPPKPAAPILKIEEIAVVGSNIRGTDSAAPVFRFDRVDIDNSGLGTTQEFLRSLPQIFGGGAAEGVVSDIKGEGASFNIADANGVNLLGMGYDATLILLNGRRMAPVGFGDVVDVSGIPLNAIERIEVMTDGASAIYGSDAVGGVVNIILRKSYEGMETQVSYGDVTSGSSENYRFSHTFGKHWSSGNVLFSYSHQQRDNLKTEDRSSTKSVPDPSDILGEDTQHDVIFSLSQQITERVDVYVDALYSTREREQNLANFGSNVLTSRTVELSSLVGGGGIDFGDSWRMDTSILHSGSSTVSSTAGASNGSNKTALDTWLVDAKMEGEVFQAWGGAARLAFGGQYRRESFDYEATPTALKGKDGSARDITAVFAELFIPIVDERNGSPGLERLEFTLAGRHEKYSDFGSSTNPKAGLLWSPVTGLNIRATYSKSYRAPLLYELSDVVSPLNSVTLRLPESPAPDSAMTPALVVRGYNGDLQAEKALNWTVGVDITPLHLPGFRLSLTYFDIDFSDKIQKPFEGAELNNALFDQGYASEVIRDPDIELINFWASQPTYFNDAGVTSLEEIEVFIDNRLHNVAAVRERGINFSLDYFMDSSLGEFTFEIEGTYLLLLERQAIETAPFIDILNTPYNPVDLNLRNSVSWKQNSLTTTVFVNYVGSYKDTRLGQEQNIEAWTTTDLNIRYDIEQSIDSWLHGATVSFSVNNLFDKEPPFVADTLGYNFDAANANALGRRISLNIAKKW